MATRGRGAGRIALVSRESADALRFFGVMDAEDVDRERLELEGISQVRFRDLVALVTPCAYVRSPQGEAELKEYVRVVDAAFLAGPIVPAPPGTVFRSARVLTSWMELHYAKLHEALGTIAGQQNPDPPYDYVRMDMTA